ncbi:MAG: hypothetical protein KL787_00075 [Taibaiella sp.]|nr:hypothetical protein [Taibaiella sp.]
MLKRQQVVSPLIFTSLPLRGCLISGIAYLDADGPAGLLINLNGAYELMQNLYLEAGMSYMNIDEHSLQQQSLMFYTGIRWNMQRRVYDFW